MKQGGHIIVEETVTSFTKEKQEVKSITRKWVIMGLEISDKKRVRKSVFIVSETLVENKNKQYRGGLFL